MIKVKGKYVSKEDYYQDSYEKIEDCLATLDLDPYSGILIGIRLRCVANHLGKSSANKLIDDFGLEHYGYHKEN
jgi:hypothetical protein